MLEHFFGQRYREPAPIVDKPLTYLNAVETDNQGNSVKVVKCVETSDNPFALLSFTDFTLESMLASGIKPQHLNIDKSVAIGVDDSAILAFESRVNDILSDN